MQLEDQKEIKPEMEYKEYEVEISQKNLSLNSDYLLLTYTPRTIKISPISKLKLSLSSKIKKTIKIRNTELQLL